MFERAGSTSVETAVGASGDEESKLEQSVTSSTRQANRIGQRQVLEHCGKQKKVSRRAKEVRCKVTPEMDLPQAIIHLIAHRYLDNTRHNAKNTAAV